MSWLVTESIKVQDNVVNYFGTWFYLLKIFVELISAIGVKFLDLITIEAFLTAFITIHYSTE